jgi:hypothetical protein
VWVCVGGICSKGDLISSQCAGGHDSEHGKASLDNMLTNHNGKKVSERLVNYRLIAEFDNCEGTVNTAFHHLKRRLDSFATLTHATTESVGLASLGCGLPVHESIDSTIYNFKLLHSGVRWMLCADTACLIAFFGWTKQKNMKTTNASKCEINHTQNKQESMQCHHHTPHPDIDNLPAWRYIGQRLLMFHI